MFDVESEIRAWKAHVLSIGSIGYADTEELESHLRDCVDDLVSRGVEIEEAFIIAVRRLGDVKVIGEEFERLSTEDLWKQLLVPAGNEQARKRSRIETAVVLGLALLGGLLYKIPALFGYGDLDVHTIVYARNAALFALFPVALYFLWKRSLPLAHSVGALGVFVVFALVVNLYPSVEPHHTSLLASLHMPMVLVYVLLFFYGGPSRMDDGPSQLASRTIVDGQAVSKQDAVGKIGIQGGAKTGIGWRSANTRLNFVRFAGETFIYAVLVGLGGLVLMGVTMGSFELLGIDAEPVVIGWVGPFGLFGLLTVASYLVWQKKNLIESLAPVLAKIFTPLFILVLASLVAAFALTPHQAFEDRNMLIMFDLILALVLALTMYSMSAKQPGDNSPPVFSGGKRNILQLGRWPALWDVLSLVLVALAVAVDGIALVGIVVRLSAYGFTPNKAAAFGENILLLVNLVLLLVYYLGYLGGRRPFQSIVVMQMRFLSVYALWAAFVVVAFPVIFGFR